jgi:hypothetical protein
MQRSCIWESPLKLPWHLVFTAKIQTARLRRINIQNGTNFYIESPVVLTNSGVLQNTNMAKSLRPGSSSVLHLGAPICNIQVTG